MADPGQTQDTKSHFDRLSATWSRNYRDLSGAMRQRVGNFSDALSVLPPGAGILDFGCGSGDITRALARNGYAMTGIDLSPAMIAVARQAPDAGAIDWAVATPAAVTLPFADAAFDGALASSVFEYHSDCEAQLREIHRVLKPGGVFAFTVPDMNFPGRRAEAKWRALATSPLWPLLQLTPRRDYFEYLRVSVNRWPLDQWLALARMIGFAAEPPMQRDASLAMIICRKPA